MAAVSVTEKPKIYPNVGGKPMVCFETNRKLAHTMVMKSAGTSVMMYGFFFVAIYTVSVHSVITESVWFDHPKYCHITLKPFNLPHQHGNG